MNKFGGAVPPLLAAIIAVLVAFTQGEDQKALEQEGKKYILELDTKTAVRANKANLAQWAYETNITEENQQNLLKIQSEVSKQEEQAWEKTRLYRWQDFHDATIRRMFESYSELGLPALPDDKYERLMELSSDMLANYDNAKICDYKNRSKCDLSMDPDITDIFAHSQNPEELKYLWVEWHKVAGTTVKANFTSRVKLENEAARLNNYTDLADWWMSAYEVSDFEKQLKKLWNAITPLYQQIHAYVRKRLRDKYGDKLVSARGPIPAHLLGNMWAQTWDNIESFTRPYPNKKEFDITKIMKQQNYTVLKMFQMSDEFFRSLNMTAMPETFWKNSILEKPTDRNIDCLGSAWDLHDGKDFRIKICATVTYEDFRTAHHEMGHLQYFLQYKDQPFIFQEGANPGFHEAVGDTIALSVSSPKHMRRIGLIEEDVEDDQTEINQLYKIALERVVFLPFGYLIDIFRYGVFRGTTPPEDYNCHYWRLREELQGVEPPVNRNEKDFDAGAKYHVTADVEYARYFVSYIIQFQFHRALCQIAGEYIPNNTTKKLFNCDIYHSVAAGNAFAKMLKMGSSKPWPDAMKALTGQREMSADGILEYFKPLQEWLEKENKKTGEYIGWESSKIQYCTAEQLAALKGK